MVFMRQTIKVVIPTLNPGAGFLSLAEALNAQEGISPRDVLVVDSSSDDDTVTLAKSFGFSIRVIPRKSFSHGKTRKEAAESLDTDIVVFMTQDALPAAKDSILRLCVCLWKDDRIGVAYGRQLPKPSASLMAKHARLFNYPAESRIKTKADIETMKIKAAFCSDVFAAYNKCHLDAVGGFDDTGFGEDTLAAAKFLFHGYAIYYCADACVYHSHDYTCWQEFDRYMKTGRFHKENIPVFEKLGKAEGEGLRFVRSELKYLYEQGAGWQIPSAFIRNVLKYAGYFIGRHT